MPVCILIFSIKKKIHIQDSVTGLKKKQKTLDVVILSILYESTLYKGVALYFTLPFC